MLPPRPPAAAGRRPRAAKKQAWEYSSSDEEGEEEDGEEIPSYSGVSSGLLAERLETQAAQLCIGTGDCVAVVPGENDDDDAFWLLVAYGGAEQLEEPLAIGGMTYEPAEWVVRERWLERRRGAAATANEYVLGEPAAVHTHLVISSSVEVFHLSHGGGSQQQEASVYVLTVAEEERICAAARDATPDSLLV